MSFNYQTGVIARRRTGTSLDPFLNIEEQQQIIGNKAYLSEIPNYFDRVQVSCNDITWTETINIPTVNQYKVDYNNGIVYFHPSREGLTCLFTYVGTGSYYLNASRIYTELNSNGDIIQTLKDIIESGEIYTLPIATETTLGGVKQGENVIIDENGVISAVGGSNLQLGETSSNAYYGDKGKSAYDHISDTIKHVTQNDKDNWNSKQDSLSGDVEGHYHTTDRDRSNHTGTQSVDTITGLATVATSGDYEDLSNKPNSINGIPSGGTEYQILRKNTSTDYDASFGNDFGHTEFKQFNFTDYSETVITNANATGTVDLDISNANIFNITLIDAVIFTFSNPVTSGKSSSLTLIINQGANAYAVTWPASVSWVGEAIPDINTINQSYILTFFTVNSGTRWYGSFVGKVTT